MHKRTLYFLLFTVAVVAQLYVPAQMIWSSEWIKHEGRQYKFIVAPVDPNDPFRGKYITLNYELNRYSDTLNTLGTNLFPGYDTRTVFAMLTTDEKGYAAINGLSLEAPESGDYLQVEAHYGRFSSDNTTKGRTVFIEFPFDKFYMDEWKAPKAEATQQELRNDTSTVTYAKVYVHEGKGVLDDVMIDDISIADYVRSH